MKRLYARFVLWLIKPALELNGPTKVTNTIVFENGTDRAVFEEVVKEAASQMYDKLLRSGRI